MNKELLNKYIHNNCSPSEIDTFFRWILDKKESGNSQFILKNYWSSCDEKNIDLSPNKDALLDNIHHQLNLRNTNTLLNIKRSILFSILTKAAVIIIIPVLTLLIYTSYFLPANSNAVPPKIVMNEVISPIGSRISLELSDGTKVWLNHGSKLIYPQRFGNNSRKVKLQGEGYFDVAHDPDKPFIVEKDEFSVVATGTEFNIRSYKTDKTSEVTLESGKVFLKHQNNTYEMNPGQHLTYNKVNKTMNLQYLKTEKYLSWKDGKLMFEDDSFEVIANRLSKWYNVDFEITDPEINELTYTGTFIDEPLYQILEMLEIVTPIKCVVRDRNKLSDGTYSRRNIAVSYKK